jgi:hypothetical protein
LLKRLRSLKKASNEVLTVSNYARTVRPRETKGGFGVVLQFTKVLRSVSRLFCLHEHVIGAFVSLLYISTESDGPEQNRSNLGSVLLSCHCMRYQGEKLH